VSDVELGRLVRVDLREAWQDEAAHFTPWLAQQENLELLGDALGIGLELEATEQSVGPFAADILCKDPMRDQWVLIENQLEQTDHTHLGQIITYAAGLNAVTVIWIARKFVEQHRAALDWLNEITAEGTDFFGVEVELWRIGESSAVAPKFNIISKPNAWSKQIAKTPREGHKWDRESFFAALQKNAPAAVGPAQEIMAWAAQRMPETWWGEGKIEGSYFPGIQVGETWHSLVSLWTYGKLEFQFERMCYRPVFDDEEKRLQLLRKLNEEVGLEIPEVKVKVRPSVPLALFEDQEKLRALLLAFDWYIDELLAGSDAS